MAMVWLVGGGLGSTPPFHSVVGDSAFQVADCGVEEVVSETLSGDIKTLL